MTTPEKPDGRDGHSEDLRRRYLEALERKRGKAPSGEPHQDAAGPSAHPSTKSQRMFRRKSG